MQSGYDVMRFACRHNDYSEVEENAYYIMCAVCGSTEILCESCVTDAVEDSE